jgi:hypothetical protein
MPTGDTSQHILRPAASRGRARRSAAGISTWAVLLLFCGWAVYRIAAHVPYRDELQALLIARESTGPISLFHNLAHEGTPGLWHLVLLPIAHVWGDPAVLAVVQSAVAIATLSLLWLGSPFSLAEKVLLSLGYFIGFEYAVLARAYGLGVLLFFLFVRLRRTRWSWLLLGLLGNVSLVALVLAGLLACLQLYRGQRSLPGIAICAVLFGLAVLTGYPAADTVLSVAEPASLPARLLKSLPLLSAAVLPANWSTPQYYWNTVCTDCGPTGLLALAYLPLLGVVSLKKSADLAIVYVANLLAAVLIGTFVYYGTVRQYGYVFIAFVGLVWIAREEGKAPAAWPLRGWAAISAIAGLWAAYWSFDVDFSQGRAAAEWIRGHGLQRAVWAAYPGWAGTDISAYLRIPTYNLQARRWNTFITWNYRSNVPLSPAQLAAAARAVGGQGAFYLVTVPLFAPSSDTLSRLRELGVSLQQIARFDHPAFGFILFRVTLARIGGN